LNILFDKSLLSCVGQDGTQCKLLVSVVLMLVRSVDPSQDV